MSIINIAYAADAPVVVACPRCELHTVRTGFERVDGNDSIAAPELGVFEASKACDNCGVKVRVRIRCSTFIESVEVAR